MIGAGQDPNITSLIGGHLILDSSLQAYSGSRGGSLSILAPSIQIGGATANPDTLLLSPDFFGSGGFSSFALTGLGGQGDQPGSYLPGLIIAPNTVLAPQVQNLMVAANANGVETLVPFLPPDGLRTPVSLALSASGVTDTSLSDPVVIRGDVVLGEGAVIKTDPQGSVSLSGDTVAVLGSILAPGGTITISGETRLSFSAPKQDRPCRRLTLDRRAFYPRAALPYLHRIRRTSEPAPYCPVAQLR